MRLLALLHLLLACATPALAHAQTTPSPADTGILWWRYAHGSGFTVSDALLAREAEAKKVAGNASLGTMANDFIGALAQAVSGAPRGDGPMNSMEALSILELANRRASAEQVLATLGKWNARRFIAQELTGYSENALMRQVFSGTFTPSLGVVPARDTLLLVSNQRYRARALIAYHGVYADRCRSDQSIPWRTLTYDGEDLVSYNRYGGEVRRTTTLATARLDVREPYADVLQTIHPGEIGFAVEDLAKGNLTPVDVSLSLDFARFLKTYGCASDGTRQMEVNLYLFMQGFPSAQSLFAGTVATAAPAKPARATTTAARTTPATSTSSATSSAKSSATSAASAATPARTAQRPEPDIDLSGIWQMQGERIGENDVLKLRITREGTEWVGRVTENSTTWRRNVGDVVLRLRYDADIDGYAGTSIEANATVGCSALPATLIYELGLGLFDNGQTLSGEEAVAVVDAQRCRITRDTTFVTRLLRRVP